MEVSVTDLRARLSDWLDHARAGEDIVVTERGLPVARLVGMETADLVNRLTRDGVIAKPATTSRPRAARRTRVRTRGSVADLVAEQRR